MNTFQNQKGVSLSGFITVAVIGISIAMIAMKIIPSYMENSKIQKAFDAIVLDPSLRSATPAEIKDAFYKRAAVVDNVTALSANDIEISQDNGQLSLSAVYSAKIPLAKNISIVVDFNPHAPKK